MQQKRLKDVLASSAVKNGFLAIVDELGTGRKWRLECKEIKRKMSPGEVKARGMHRSTCTMTRPTWRSGLSLKEDVGTD
ncbi:hypothetical protein PC116_g27325 [Phytophthora cactorum]|nr:hypothetical protein PC116_g27325 [Phytophthora cactorum]